MMNVKIKKLHKDAVIPTYGHDTDAGCDLTATSMNETEKYIEYGTGLSFELPIGWYAEIFPRSSISKYDLILANSVGIIDESYRGEVSFRFKKVVESNKNHFYKIGDKIGQLILKTRPLILFEEVSEISTTKRGAGGYGSTGQ